MCLNYSSYMFDTTFDFVHFVFLEVRSYDNNKSTNARDITVFL